MIPFAVLPRPKNRAFSTIEALLSIVVTIVAIMALLAITPMSFTHTETDAVAIEAIAAGQQYMDTLRHYVQKNGNDNTSPNWPQPANPPIDAGGVMEGTLAPATSPGNFLIVGNCPLKTGATVLVLYDCTVTVTWTLANTDRTISIESYATLQG